jgi:hypothetical protein
MYEIKIVAGPRIFFVNHPTTGTYHLSQHTID